MKKKSQHTVPQFYLRLFSYSGEGKQIGVFNKKSGLFVPCAKLKKQACKSYFYGRDGRAENALEKIESSVGAAIKRILIDTNSARQTDLLAVRRYLVLQYVRTEHADRAHNESIEKLVAKISTREPDNELIGQLRGLVPLTKVMLLNLGIKLAPQLDDLRPDLLGNRTDFPFIISDHPVVIYNQYLEQTSVLGSHAGLASAGAQVFFPLSPTVMLMLFDRHVYRITPKNKFILELSDKNDIQSLNTLQMLNCLENVYFDSKASQAMINKIASRASKFQSNELTEVRMLDPKNGDPSHSLFAFNQTDIRCNLTASGKSPATHFNSENNPRHA